MATRPVGVHQKSRWRRVGVWGQGAGGGAVG